MQKNRPGLSFDFREAPRPAMRSCESPGCCEAGEHRAPKSRKNLNEYRWFCLEHVREYNKAWDYYAGMNEAEIESHRRRDTTWDRPTWPMGNWRAREERLRESVLGSDFVFGSDWSGATRQEARKERARTPEELAMAELELLPPLDMKALKTRYRELVKLHHPDANGGDKAAEERLKRINQAYNTLKTSLSAG